MFLFGRARLCVCGHFVVWLDEFLSECAGCMSPDVVFCVWMRELGLCVWKDGLGSDGRNTRVYELQVCKKIVTYLYDYG